MKIGIVNDVQMAVTIMRRVIESLSGHQVIWTARDGAEAVERCSQNRPDVVLMDLIMPGVDGIDATRRIMKDCPCAVVVVTATVEGNTAKVFEAMGAGALDVVQTPTLNGNGAAEFLYKIESMAKLLGESPEPFESAPGFQDPTRRLIAIGASAGGPAALAKLLGALPANLPAGIVIVQHVDAQFAPGLAGWLGEGCRLAVKVAKDNDPIEKGVVLVAGTNDHLILKAGRRVAYTKEPAHYSYRPSVNVFFESIPKYWRGDVIGILLTGMGRDGANGLKVLRDAGHHTIAQDRATSAVYGMPKAAVELDAADEVLPLEGIAEALIRRIRSHAAI